MIQKYLHQPHIPTSKCNSLHPFQCPICMKMFASKQGKYEHKKYVKCSPPTQSNHHKQ